MTAIVFEPYVGPKYHNEPQRVLIVGESHYGFEDEPRDATQYVMHAWRTGKAKQRYLTTLARILSGKAAKQLDRKSEFDAFAWYNFVQAAMPTLTTDFTRNPDGSSAAFREILATLRPTHIVVTGTKKLWANLPPSDEKETMKVFAGKLLPLRRYQTPSGFALATAIAHTSRASAAEWLEPVKAFRSA